MVCLLGLLFSLDRLCLYRLLLCIRVLVCSLFVAFLADYKKRGCCYLGFLNSIVPSGVVSWYVKSCARSCLARSLSVVPSTIHSPLVPASRCMYFCVVSSRLWPMICLTISAFCILRSRVVT